MTDLQPILDRIEDIVAEEHRLYADAEAGRLDEAGHARLAAIRGDLNRAWDLLRRRRADPNAPETPIRDADVPDPNYDFDGPDPEPPHEPGVSETARNIVANGSRPGGRVRRRPPCCRRRRC